MLRKVFTAFLVMLFCFSVCGVALGAGKTEIYHSLYLAGASGKIPPGQWKKINEKINGEALKKQNGNKKHNKDKVKVRVRGKDLVSELPPVIKDGRTLIPVRAVTMGLGAAVDWDVDERKITIAKDNISIVLYADEYVFYVNGVKKELDVPAQLISNRTFVPLRFLAIALNIHIHYDEDNNEVIIGDEILETFTVGGKDVLALEGIVVQNPGDAGAELKVADFTNFKGITVKADNDNATTINILLNGSLVKSEDLAGKSIKDGDVILAIVTATGENGTITKYYKVTVVGTPSASFSFIGPYNIVETDQDISGFAVTVKEVSHIKDNVPLRYLFQMTEGNLNGKVIQYGQPAQGSFTIQNGRAYFGPQGGFTLADLPELTGTTGLTTPFTIKNGLSQGKYKFTISLVDLNDNILVTSGQFSIEVGP